MKYLSNKVAQKKGAKVRLCDYFGTYENFFKYNADEAARKPFLEKCTAAEMEAAAFCRQALEGQVIIHELVREAIEENWLQPAEIILRKPGWVENQLLDLDELLKESDELAEKASREAQKAEVDAAISVPDPDKESAEVKDEVPEGVREEIAPEPSKSETPRKSFFEVAQVPSWAEDLFKKVSLPTFENTLQHAKLCAGLRPCAWPVTHCMLILSPLLAVVAQLF